MSFELIELPIEDSADGQAEIETPAFTMKDELIGLAELAVLLGIVVIVILLVA